MFEPAHGDAHLMVPGKIRFAAMKRPPPLQAPHPRAVLLARGFLVLVGVFSLALAVGMMMGGVPTPAWWAPAVATLVGIAVLLSAAFERPAGVVATFLILFFPWT